MEFLEKDLESIIWESDKKRLEEKGLKINGVLKRQIRIGNYGVADLVSFRREVFWDYDTPKPLCIPFMNITVYELKKEKIGISAFLQALNYCKGIKTYLENRKPYFRFNFKIVLVGRSVDTSGSFIFLEDMIYNDDYKPTESLVSIDFYSYKYGIDGLEFRSECGYNLSNKGF